MRQYTRRRAGFTIVELLIVIVVIAILAAITIVAYTGISDRAKQSAKATTLAQWKKESELYKVENSIECPENYVFVYGNSILGTSDFCVMKYEAKDVGGVATSQPDGDPWVSLTQVDAISAAEASCAGCRLITEQEWFTIAADVLTVPYNWSGGEVGSGYVYQGHINNNPANALPASSDDTDSLYGMTGGFSDTTGGNSHRTLYLSSGDVLWDLVGNVWEWTNDTIVGTQPGASGYTWRQYTSLSSWGNLSASSRPSALSSIEGLSGISTWNSDQGIGQIYSDSDSTTTRAFMRSGNWAGTNTRGILTLHLGLGTGSVNSSVGFRVTK